MKTMTTKLLISLTLLLVVSQQFARAIECKCPSKVHRRLWIPGQDLHVDIDGLEPEQEAELVEYFKERTKLADLNIIYDGDLSAGGIKMFFARDLNQDPFLTRKSFIFEEIGTAGEFRIVERKLTMQSFIDLDYLDLYPEGSNRTNAFKNASLHEFLNALGLAHIKPYNQKVVRALMNKELSTHRPMFEFADKQALFQLYGQTGKTLTLNEEDIGKTVYLIKRNKKEQSISFTVDKTEVILKGLRGKYKRIIE